jgi:hypothetical protein
MTVETTGKQWIKELCADFNGKEIEHHPTMQVYQSVYKGTM